MMTKISHLVIVEGINALKAAPKLERHSIPYLGQYFPPSSAALEVLQRFTKRLGDCGSPIEAR